MLHVNVIMTRLSSTLRLIALSVVALDALVETLTLQEAKAANLLSLIDSQMLEVRVSSLDNRSVLVVNKVFCIE